MGCLRTSFLHVAQITFRDSIKYRLSFTYSKLLIIMIYKKQLRFFHFKYYMLLFYIDLRGTDIISKIIYIFCLLKV